MTTPELAALRRRAIAFRQAIEHTDAPIGFSHFPRGACGDTSLLLGAYLKDCGFGTFDYILGERGGDDTRHSHAWIRSGEVDVDVTADQFEDGPAEVIVEVRSEWHRSFRQSIEYEADHRIFDDRTATRLDHAYQVLSPLADQIHGVR